MSLRRGFVLRFEAAREALARQAADTLRAHVQGTPARIESAERDQPGTSPGGHGIRMVIGIRDDDGEPRWLAPIPVRDEPTGAAEDALGFLERWGFLPRRSRRA